MKKSAKGSVDTISFQKLKAIVSFRLIDHCHYGIVKPTVDTIQSQQSNE